ncbi:cyclic pyranopterin monophosphate synthase MoaC [Clostridium intestinale]|uniref:Cyclic pyranopterin monophosphate synthase n=1 Tax=Clostridium intestinale URNW TaxID=1294142 RepID=U2NIT9_9CLOT|nr:cyclic pyranopterin monophosphate synthase MoaC [Clostridium intestinale]ERK29033.1 cyclic pyranopterin monophosphate synthase subunit MoaC [Clostridium intestinale URNW]
MEKLTHFDEQGKAKMVDVTEKDITKRVARAFGKIQVSPETLKIIGEGKIGKGDVLGVARIAGIMGSKKTSDLIPMCHPLLINGCKIEFNINRENNEIEIYSEVKVSGKTGVEMEALTAVSITALTIYDMCKAVDKGMIIKDIHLLEKIGGKSGHFLYDNNTKIK